MCLISIIDNLHRTFVTGPFGLTIGLDELFTSGTEISIGTRPLLALSAEHQFLHACYNVALGDYPVRLCSVRDLLLCLQHLDVDLDQIVAIAARWNGTAVVQRAAAAAIETVGAQVAAGFIELHALTVPRRGQWLMGSYLTAARSYSHSPWPRSRSSLGYGPGSDTHVPSLPRVPNICRVTAGPQAPTYNRLYEGYDAMVDRFRDDTVICRAPDALHRQLLDGVLVCSPTQTGSLRISTPGDIIWQLAAEPITVAELAETIADLYDIAVDKIRADIEAVLISLADGAVTSVDPPAV